MRVYIAKYLTVIYAALFLYNAVGLTRTHVACSWYLCDFPAILAHLALAVAVGWFILAYKSRRLHPKVRRAAGSIILMYNTASFFLLAFEITTFLAGIPFIAEFL